jgi:regulator of protease activity HflC (stomatin/prohibitin superfamily)
MNPRDFTIKDTHRGLLYRDGVLDQVLGAGRHRFPPTLMQRLLMQQPRIEIQLIDMRARELTIKGQEILTSDKVALRVSILVQFNVTDPKMALHAVENYADRLYSDVQLAARRALAQMTLEEILTNRHRLSEEILADVQEAAAGYGVAIGRADIKDLTFPGNLQEIMNRVLATQRQSEAQLVEARTRAEVQKIEAATKAEVQRSQAVAEADSVRTQAAARAEADRLAVTAELESLARRRELAGAFTEHPALLRLEELQTLRDLGRNANARIHLSLDGQPASRDD